MNQVIVSENAPAAIGPYSQAVFEDGWLFASGQLGIDPKTGMLSESIEAQCHQALKNLGEILKQAGMTYDNVVKTTVFLHDMNDFAAVNEIYAMYFSGRKPARSCVQVTALPKNGLIEVECVAHKLL